MLAVLLVHDHTWSNNSFYCKNITYLFNKEVASRMFWKLREFYLLALPSCSLMVHADFLLPHCPMISVAIPDIIFKLQIIRGEGCQWELSTWVCPITKKTVAFPEDPSMHSLHCHLVGLGYVDTPNGKVWANGSS